MGTRRRTNRRASRPCSGACRPRPRLARAAAGSPRARCDPPHAGLRDPRFGGLLALGQPFVYELFVRAGRRGGLDVDALVNRSVHALKPPSAGAHDEFGRWLRRRPSPPLLAFLERRLRTFDRERLRRRAERGERAARVVPAGLYHPGRKAAQRTHWVFPVACESPTRLIDLLR